jgi:hypothetical protein
MARKIKHNRVRDPSYRLKRRQYDDVGRARYTPVFVIPFLSFRFFFKFSLDYELVIWENK